MLGSKLGSGLGSEPGPKAGFTARGGTVPQVPHPVPALVHKLMTPLNAKSAALHASGGVNATFFASRTWIVSA